MSIGWKTFGIKLMNIRGSISFHASEEAYTKMIDRINAQRNVSDDLRGCTMIHEFKGSAFAVLSKVGS